MLQDSIYLSRELEIFITVPFRLGFNITPKSRSEREKLFPRWAEKLNLDIQQYNWDCQTFPDDAPVTIKDRKSVFLQGRLKDTGRLISWVKDLLRDEKSIEVINAEETIWYYDWGLGAEDLTFTIKVLNEENIGFLNDLTQRIRNNIYFHEYMRTKGEKDNDQNFKTALFENWEINSKLLLSLMGGSESTYNFETREESLCGWTKIHHFALFLKTTDKEGIFLNKQQIKNIMESFAGEKLEEGRDCISLPRIHASLEGMNGAVVILDTYYRTEEYGYFNVLEKVKWINRFATLFYSNLNNYVDRLAEKMLETQITKTNNPKESLKQFRNERLKLQLFLNESSPRTVAVDDATAKKIYNGLWESFQGNKTVEEINYQLGYLQSFYADSISLESSWLQTKMNYILLVLNIMTFATVIATLIMIYDINNEAIRPTLRLLFVATGVGLFALLSLLIIRSHQ